MLGKSESKEFVIPNEFTLTDTDISRYQFYKTGKSKTSQEELEKNGDIIDRDIKEYMETDEAKILGRKLDDFP